MLHDSCQRIQPLFLVFVSSDPDPFTLSGLVNSAHQVYSPITTYGGQGVAKPGIEPRSHTTLNIRGTQSDIDRDEWEMTKTPLEVVPFSISSGAWLHGKSRLNFGKVHTVEHNLRVCPIGRFSQESMLLYHGYVQEALSV